MAKIKVGISIGDLNGIGMEVIIKTFLNSRMMDFCTPIVIPQGAALTLHKLVEAGALHDRCPPTEGK